MKNLKSLILSALITAAFFFLASESTAQRSVTYKSVVYFNKDQMHHAIAQRVFIGWRVVGRDSVRMENGRMKYIVTFFKR